MIEWIWGVGLGMGLLGGLWLVLGSRLSSGVKTAPTERMSLNAESFEDELEALQQRLEAGELSAERFEEARAQLGSGLAADLRDQGQWSLRGWGLPARLVIIGICVGLSGLMFHLSDGSQHFQSMRSAESAPSVEQMVAGLEARLASEPDDLRGWAMLGRSYAVLERPADAARAFARANQLSGSNNPELLIAEAEALGLANQHDLRGRPTELLEAALALAPNHFRALWYAGIAASQRQDGGAARAYFERVAAQPDLPPELARLLETEFGIRAAADEPPADGLYFDLTVDLSEDARKGLPPQGVLFVYARALNGPPMPLAVSRQSLPGQWPVTVRLDDSMGMMAGMKLSDHEAWRITARVSASGNAQPSSGDWIGDIRLDAVPQAPVDVVIGERVP